MTVTTSKTTWVQDEQDRWVMPKDPDAILDYSLDWTKWLAEVNDTIDVFTIVLADDSEIFEELHGFEGPITFARISGGETVGSLQSVTFRVVTTSGLQDDRTVYLQITDR